MKKIAIISLESAGTMGHMTLITSLASKMSNNKNNKLFVFSQYNYKKLSNLKNNLVNYIKLPKQESSYTVGGCLNYKPRDLLIRSLIKNKIKIVIFSTFFDKALLKKIKRLNIKIILISYPLRDSHRKAFFIRKYYSLFDNIFTLKDLFDIGVNYPNEKIVSPILRTKKQNSNFNPKIKNVLITCGGATRPSSNIFFMKIKKIVSRIKRHYPSINILVIKAGFRKSFRIKRVTMLKWSTKFLDLINNSDIVISEGGYFTLTELIATCKPAIIIPGERRIDNQELRALRYQELGGGLTFFPTEPSKEIKKALINLIEKPTALRKFHNNLINIKNTLFSNVPLDVAVSKEIKSI